MTQASLPFCITPSYRAEDFIISGCNEEAYHWLMQWPDWSANAFYLYGDAGSGKTHLAHVWREKSRARFLPEDELQSYIEGHETTPIILELSDISGNEERLFHLLNKTRQENTPLLLTYVLPPAQGGFRLPDVVSRLNALPSARLGQPDDTLMTVILTKLFADRQILVTDEIIQYLVKRLERSFSAVSHAVARLDEEALRQKQRMSISLVKKTLDFTG